MARASIDIAQYEQAIKPFQKMLETFAQPSDDFVIWFDGFGKQLTAGHVRDLLMVELTVVPESNPGPPPQTQGPGPKPAAKFPPQPVEAAPRQAERDHRNAASRDEALHALTWLFGFVSCADPDGRTSQLTQLQVIDDYLHRDKLDPRVTWSADYQLAEKLGTQLETLRADLANLQNDSWSAANISEDEYERLSQIRADLEAAIKTCNTLGPPF